MSAQINKKILFSIIGVSVLNLLLLFYFKYTVNCISINSFSIFKTGNLINLFITIVFIVGIFVNFLHQNRSESFFRIVLFLLVVSLIPLLLVIIFTITEFSFVESYFLSYPIKKIVPLALLVFNQIILIYVTVMIWINLFETGVMLYLYSLLGLIGFVVLLLLISFSYSFLIDEYDIENKGEKFDYGIVLGAAVWNKDKPSPIFLGRIKKGAELYNKNILKKIQLTGGNAPGELSEAKAAYKYLVDNYDIEPDDILIEEVTATTNEQIRFIKELVNSDVKNKKFLFISDYFHLGRIKEMANFYNLKAEVISSDYKLNLQKSLYYGFRDTIGLILFWFFAV